MANTKISALSADTGPTDDDLVVTVNDPGGTPATKKCTVANFKKQNVSTKTADYTATSADDAIFFDLSGGIAKTLTLEPAANRARPRLVKNLGISTADLTIDADGAETIDGATTIILAPGDKVQLMPRSSSAWETI